MSRTDYQPGDWVVYRKSKVSSSPGPRANDVHPTRSGDNYTYVVEKYWVVDAVLADGTVKLRTPGGKTHELPAEDPDLRPANFLERWLRRDRFVKAEQKGPVLPANSQARAS